MPEQLATACERFRDNHWPRWPDKLRFLWMMTNNYCSVCEDPWFLGPPNLSAQRACSDSKSICYRAFSFVTWNSSCIYLDSIESHNFSRSPDAIFTCTWCVKACTWNCMIFQGGISSSILSVIFTDKFALSQSDARISVAYKISQWKSLTKCLMKCPPDLEREIELNERDLVRGPTHHYWWKKEFPPWWYTLLKSDVTSRDHVVRCRGSHAGMWLTLCQFRL